MKSLKTLNNNQIHLYKRNRSPFLYVRYKVGNTWRKQSTGTDDMDKATQIALELFEDTERRIKWNLPVNTRKFKSVAKHVLNEMKTNIVNGNGIPSYEAYSIAIDNYILDYFGEYNIDSISPDRIDGYYDYLSNMFMKKYNRKPKRTTVNNHNIALMKIFNYALRHKWILPERIPVLHNNGEKPYKRPTFDKSTYNSLSKKLFHWKSKTHGLRNVSIEKRVLLYHVFHFLSATGVRPMREVYNLKWNNIRYFTHGDGNKYVIMNITGKTGERTIVGRHTVRRQLLGIKDTYPDLVDVDMNDVLKLDRHVFRLPNMVKPKDMNMTFQKFLYDVDCLYDFSGKKYSLYSLRHFYITQALLKGVNIHYLSIQCGNSVKTIEKHYSHVIPMIIADQLGGQYFSEIDRLDMGEVVE